MLRLTALGNAEYPLSAVAAVIDDYYLGLGEAPGVWLGRWSAELGLEGVVDAASLRALVQGQDPRSWAEWLAGHRDRKVAVWDATVSSPKSVSLLWAFGSSEVAATVMHAHVDAVGVAMRFLEERAAFARRQEAGVRVRVGTGGFAVASFVHRTSREGDPQIHSHCLIPNVVRRDDGAYVAFDASPLHEWAKAAGTIYQAELQRLLTARLGVVWGPERNGTRRWWGSAQRSCGRSRSGRWRSRRSWPRPGRRGSRRRRGWPPMNALR
jgi:conjugative relaxase-like TrwC/TraI family protein